MWYGVYESQKVMNKVDAGHDRATGMSKVSQVVGAAQRGDIVC
jgi:hypothetical protein